MVVKSARYDLGKGRHIALAYVETLGVVGLVTAASVLVRGFLAPTNLTMLYLLAVVIIALQWGRGPAILAATLAVAAFDFFFVPPYFSFAVADTQYLLTFAALLVVGLVVSTLASRTREQAQAARRRESYTAALHALSGELAGTSEPDAIMQAIARHIAATFSRSVALFLPDGEELQPRLVTQEFPLHEHERALARWVFRHGEPAGYGTDRLPEASARYLPLKTARGTVGCSACSPRPPRRHSVRSSGVCSTRLPARRRLRSSGPSWPRKPTVATSCAKRNGCRRPC